MGICGDEPVGDSVRYGDDVRGVGWGAMVGGPGAAPAATTVTTQGRGKQEGGPSWTSNGGNTPVPLVYVLHPLAWGGGPGWWPDISIPTKNGLYIYVFHQIKAIESSDILVKKSWDLLGPDVFFKILQL